ncbi:MAG: acetyl-CoA carboxylase biotin carboxyl carrier protein [Planctomycetota bacterium]
MDLGVIRKLVRLMERAELTELEIDDTNAGLRVHLKRGGGGAEGGSVVHVLPGAVGAGAPAAAPVAAAGAPAADASAAGGAPAGTVPFESPMVGTFYRSSSPDSDPFASAGTKVSDDSVLCIIEAMKVMNEIKAETKGEVVEVLVENGEPVEFGQPLFLIRPA